MMLRVLVSILLVLICQDLVSSYPQDRQVVNALKSSKTRSKRSETSDRMFRPYPWYLGSMEACLLSLGDEAYPPEGEVYCNATWDSVLCWPPARAGSTVYQPCPPLRGLDPLKYAEKICGADGHWEGKYPGDTSKPQGWTNYTRCYRPSTWELYNTLFNKPSRSSYDRPTY